MPATDAFRGRRPNRLRPRFVPTVEGMESRQLLATGLVRAAAVRIAAPSEAVGASSGLSLNLPLGPQFDLGTRWQRLGTTNGPSVVSANALAMGSDQTVWVGQGTGSGTALYRYNLRTSVWTNVWTAPGPIVAVAPGTVWRQPGTTNAVRQVWVIYEAPGTGANTVVRLTNAGNRVAVAPVPALPGGRTIAQIAPAADGTVWAIGSDQAPYRLSARTQSWVAVPTGGRAISSIAVGSANSIWALVDAGAGNLQVYRYAGGTFQRDATFNPPGEVETLSATADGAVWATVGNASPFTAYVRSPDSGTWAAVPSSSPAIAFTGLAGGTRYRAVGVVPDQSGKQRFAVLTYGVADQPATGFPAMDAGEALGYAYISQQVGLDPGSGGIRAQYANAGYLSQLGDDYTTIKGLTTPPPNVSLNDWRSIRSEVLSEIRAVQGVYGIFGNIDGLMAKIQGQATSQLQSVGTLVTLSKGDNNSWVSLLVGPLFNAILSGMTGGLNDNVARIVGGITAGIEAGVDEITGGNPDQAIQAQYAELSTKLSNVITTANLTNAGYKAAILADWGRIKTVGSQVVTGQWNWPAGTGTTLANRTVNGFESYFFRALLPLKWELVGYGSGSFEQPWVSSVNVPSYARHFAAQGVYNNGVTYGTLYFIHDSNSTDDPYTDPGPFPTTGLLNQICKVMGGSASAAKVAFLTGANGWLPVNSASARPPRPPRR